MDDLEILSYQVTKLSEKAYKDFQKLLKQIEDLESLVEEAYRYGVQMGRTGETQHSWCKESNPIKAKLKRIKAGEYYGC